MVGLSANTSSELVNRSRQSRWAPHDTMNRIRHSLLKVVLLYMGVDRAVADRAPPFHNFKEGLRYGFRLFKMGPPRHCRSDVVRHASARLGGRSLWTAQRGDGPSAP